MISTLKDFFFIALVVILFFAEMLMGALCYITEKSCSFFKNISEILKDFKAFYNWKE